MFIIGIAGGSGSGKTTFARKVLNRVKDLDVSLIHQDSYYLPNGSPASNLDHPLAFDWELLKFHLSELRSGRAVGQPVYDYKSFHRTSEVEEVGPCKAIIVEGIYALWSQEIRDLLDLKVFLSVDADIRFIRRLNRDVRERGRSVDQIVHRYYETVRPMHYLHLEPTKQYADVVVGEETDIAADVIASRLRQALVGGTPGLSVMKEAAAAVAESAF
jgi:uridine kinase